MTIPDAGDAVARLSLEEKAALTSGADFWRTKRVGSIPSVILTDGPHGLRKKRDGTDGLGLGDSVPATCFPPAVGIGSSFDPELMRRVGVALGVESVIEDVAVLLGPGINIKRSPLCGRNFEYFSEDPIVSGVMGAAWVNGVQSQGVGASLKHFAANNQETDRLRVSSDVDPRPLREIYLRGFQRVVQDAQPWTVMCAYNRINGVPASENPWLLTRVLRDEWGFEGLVVSDWGAVADRVAALVAGLDLEMPSTAGHGDARIVAAVERGEIDRSVVDASATRVASMALRAHRPEGPPAALDVEAHHRLAREAAGRSIVLLKNEGQLLPLSPDAAIAVIGAFAAEPRYQGAGSSRINPTRLDVAVEEIMATARGEVRFSPGFSIERDASPATRERLRAEAVATAASSDVAVLFLGLPAHLESEGFDRAGLDLPVEQLELLDAVLAVNARTVVVLSNGGVVTLPFADRVPAILETWLLGQAGGGATADVLFGAVNPSGKLTETIPLRLQDTPAYGNFPGSKGHVRYGEGLLVGYRWYDARELDVAFPFGHGLSYTSFEYGPASASVAATGDLEITVTVSNVGGITGREIVQVYSSLPDSDVERPVRELKAFASVSLAPGERAEAVMRVRRDDLAYWDTRIDEWVVEPGTYRFDVAASSRDIRSTVIIAIDGSEARPPITRESTLGEVLSEPAAAAALNRIRARAGAGIEASGDDDERQILSSFPIGRHGMSGLSERDVQELIESVSG